MDETIVENVVQRLRGGEKKMETQALVAEFTLTSSLNNKREKTRESPNKRRRSAEILNSAKQAIERSSSKGRISVATLPKTIMATPVETPKI